MKQYSVKAAAALVLLLGIVPEYVPAQTATNTFLPGTITSSRPGQTAASNGSAKAPSDAQPVHLSAVTVQVLKLLDAGVSKPVIEAYIQQASIPEPLHAADLIALKEKSVPDDLTLAMLNRAGRNPAASPNEKGQSTAASDRSLVAAPQYASRGTYRAIDPESYDFWWYHYAYPRALAAANEQLFSSYRPFFQGAPEAYGYYPPLVFGPPH